MNVQELLDNVKTTISVKTDTLPGDVVLVGMESGLFYGFVQEIKKNSKKNWWDIYFKLIILPPVDMVWILRTPQMRGEIFTINDKEHFMIAVDMNRTEQAHKPEHENTSSKAKKSTLTLVT